MTAVVLAGSNTSMTAPAPAYNVVAGMFFFATDVCPPRNLSELFIGDANTNKCLARLFDEDMNGAEWVVRMNGLSNILVGVDRNGVYSGAYATVDVKRKCVTPSITYTCAYSVDSGTVTPRVRADDSPANVEVEVDRAPLVGGCVQFATRMFQISGDDVATYSPATETRATARVPVKKTAAGHKRKQRVSPARNPARTTTRTVKGHNIS